jgi:hypothetical protein
MDQLNKPNFLALLAALALAPVGFAQPAGSPVKQFETPTALIAVYIDPAPSIQRAEETLLQLRAGNPSKLMIRAALYQSAEDAHETEEHPVMGHTSPQAWNREHITQRSRARPMAEAIQINGYGILRSYRDGIVEMGTPSGLLPLEEISCGQSKMRFLYLADGQIGPTMRNFLQLSFQWIGNTTQADAECLATKIGFKDLTPADLAMSSNPLFALDTHYPRFNRFIASAYDEAQGSPQPLKKAGPDFACSGIVHRQTLDCVTIKEMPQ